MKKHMAYTRGRKKTPGPCLFYGWTLFAYFTISPPKLAYQHRQPRVSLDDGGEGHDHLSCSLTRWKQAMSQTHIIND